MSEADKLFKELGYEIYTENDETLIYHKKSDFFKVSLTFDKRDFMRTFHGIEGRWVAKNSATWVTQKFKNEFDKYSSANGYWSSIWHEFSVEELKAINKKVEELGWNE